MMVVVEQDAMSVGLLVDRVIGIHQTVIKPLSEMYQDNKSFSGATILGDGTVALILNVEHLVTRAEREEEARSRPGAGVDTPTPSRPGPSSVAS